MNKQIEALTKEFQNKDPHLDNNLKNQAKFPYPHLAKKKENDKSSIIFSSWLSEALTKEFQN
jgi:hypothetical protein